MALMQTAAGDNWQDQKRYWRMLSPALPLLAVVTLWVYHITGFALLLWIGPVMVYLLIPLADWLIGTDATNPPAEVVRPLAQDRYYAHIVYAYIPAQYIYTIWAAWLVASGNLSVLDITGLILTAGALNGIGINTAHELGHKKAALDCWLAKLALAPVAYGHFFVEHNRGHHRNVATPQDPASARMGESFWQFLPRTMIGSLRSAWAIESKRLARYGKKPWSLRNENLQAWLLTLVLYAVLIAWLGWFVLPFLLLQAFYGASLLEVVNYIEHYGLLRQKLPDGSYEKCQPRHSWNSNHLVTNLFLYQLQRHSDHHAHPGRPYQALRHFDDSPQLPSGYASMLIPAYVPFLWFRKMDPLVFQHYQGDLNRANIHPPRRAKILATWEQAHEK